MKSRLLPLMFLLGSAVLFSGCTVISELPQEELKKQGDSPEFLKGRELLTAFLKNDAGGFVSLLSPEARKVFDRDKFRAMRANIVETLGTPVSFRFLTTLEMTALKPNLWAVRFKRVKQPSGKEFYQEAVFRVTTARADGEANVIGFNFE